MKGAKVFSLGYVGHELDIEKHVLFDFGTDLLYLKDPTTYNVVSLNIKERKELFKILEELGYRD